MNKFRPKGIYILPNLFTTTSLFSGFLGILWAIEGLFVWAALAIMVSFVCDGLDGKVARITKASSQFGVQMDSLADLVSFGVCPAVLLYLWQTNIYNRFGMVSCFLFVACGALRLARFNVHAIQGTGQTNKFFVGLPIPAAACVIASLVLFSTYLPANLASTYLPPISVVLLYLMALLMVSKVRYASFKNVEAIKAHPYTISLAVVLVFVLVASEPKLFSFAFFISYLLSGLVYSFILTPLKNGTFLRGLSRHKPS